ncbi:MAG: DUF4476 domain-containing protein, partial [Bacteroidia bacterium]|nr:DUF4476 domain-containing protein [Bacteroidia bacterium]
SIIVKTKEEKSIQKIIFLNDTTSTCIYPIDTSDFNKALRHIQSTPNVDRKIVLIEQFIKHNCFNQLQIQTIIEQVPFEVEKLKIMKQILPKVNNVFNLYTLSENLKYPLAQQSFTEYYTQYLNNLKNNPTLPDSLLKSVINNISSFKDDLQSLSLLKTILSHFSISYHQLESFLQLLQHDQSKEELLQCAYYCLKNKNEFLNAIQLLHFQESKQRIKKFYEQHN